MWNAGSYAKYGDGGSHDSYSFTYRPDALRLRAKRTDDKTEISHIIAYLWSGTFKSKVPSSATTGGAITYGAELDDVDRVVLGRQDEGWCRALDCRPCLHGGGGYIRCRGSEGLLFRFLLLQD